MKIPKNKKCVLLGANGCGKSTLFLHANGLLKPNSGDILMKGEKIEYKRHYLKMLRQKIGLLFQDSDQQIISPIVKEDIAFGLRNLGVSSEEAEQKVLKIMKKFSLTELQDEPIHLLSHGQKRRVALAGVMVLKPELLLLDEPTTFLDPLQISHLIKALNDIHDSGTTALITTHDIDFAYDWAEYIFIMDKGQIIAEGIPDEVFENKSLIEELHLKTPFVYEVKKKLCHGNPELLEKVTSKEDVLDLLHKRIIKDQEELLC